MLKRIVFGLCFVAAACASTTSSLPQMRMTPSEIESGSFGESQIGSSKVAGVRSKVLAGDPSKPGFYSILLFVPPHTTIQAHAHRDDRMATVVSGEWHFGFGTQFDARALKTLPPGGVYSEPGGTDHFARTDKEAVIVHVCGYGPTDTKYFDPKNDPSRQQK